MAASLLEVVCPCSESESLVSEEECGTITVDVEYPPGTKVKVRYGRQRNVKLYDAKVMDVKIGEDREILYCVHYSGWNIRYSDMTG